MKPLTGVASVVGILCLLALTGCEGLRDPVPPTPVKRDPVETAPADPPLSEILKDLKPKQADLPELPKGAGPIDDDAPDELVPTERGLYYRILRKSNGRKPTLENSVVAHYRGWLDDGTQFDSSYDRGQPSPFMLSGVIPRWIEGLQLIGEGGMIELEVPGRMAYPEGRPGIPPNSTLHFIVEIKEVK